MKDSEIDSLALYMYEYTVTCARIDLLMRHVAVGILTESEILIENLCHQGLHRAVENWWKLAPEKGRNLGANDHQYLT